MVELPSDAEGSEGEEERAGGGAGSSSSSSPLPRHTLSPAGIRALVEELLAARLQDSLVKTQRAASHAVEAATASGAAAAASSEGAASAARASSALTSSLHALEAALECERAARRVDIDSVKARVEAVEAGLRQSLGVAVAEVERRVGELAGSLAGARQHSQQQQQPQPPFSASTARSTQRSFQGGSPAPSPPPAAAFEEYHPSAPQPPDSSRMATLEQRLSDMADNVLLLTGELNTVQSAMYTGGGSGSGGGSSSPSAARPSVVTLSATSGRSVLSAESLLRARARGLVAEGMLGTGQGVQMEQHSQQHSQQPYYSARAPSPSGNSATQTDCEAEVQTEGGGSSSSSSTASPLQRSMAAAREVVRGRSTSASSGGSSGGRRSSGSASRPAWDSTNTLPVPALGSLRGLTRGGSRSVG